MSDEVVIVQPETEGAAHISLERALDLVRAWVRVNVKVRVRVRVRVSVRVRVRVRVRVSV